MMKSKQLFFLFCSLFLCCAVALAQEAQKSALQQKAEEELRNAHPVTARYTYIKAYEDYANQGKMKQSVECAIKATQDAYMPNAQRKKEYLAIYADICKENETLVKFIVQLSHRTRTKSLLEATGSRPNHNGVHASSAFSRWRNAGWKTQSGGGSSTDDSNTESGTIVIDENP